MGALLMASLAIVTGVAELVDSDRKVGLRLVGGPVTDLGVVTGAGVVVLVELMMFWRLSSSSLPALKLIRATLTSLVLFDLIRTVLLTLVVGAGPARALLLLKRNKELVLTWIWLSMSLLSPTGSCSTNSLSLSDCLTLLFAPENLILGRAYLLARRVLSGKLSWLAGGRPSLDSK